MSDESQRVNSDILEAAGLKSIVNFTEMFYEKAICSKINQSLSLLLFYLFLLA